MAVMQVCVCVRVPMARSPRSDHARPLQPPPCNADLKPAALLHGANGQRPSARHHSTATTTRLLPDLARRWADAPAGCAHSSSRWLVAGSHASTRRHGHDACLLLVRLPAACARRRVPPHGPARRSLAPQTKDLPSASTRAGPGTYRGRHAPSVHRAARAPPPRQPLRLRRPAHAPFPGSGWSLH
jgi:hypothetical protein